MSPSIKSIPASRDKLQSKLLTVLVGSTLAIYCFLLFFFTVVSQKQPRDALFSQKALGVSLTFGLIVWALRSATFPAALAGAAICWLVTVGSDRTNESIWRSGLTPLMVLFALTFCATRLGRARKEQTGLAESRRGRRASQVVANLGASALVVLACYFGLFDSMVKGAGILGFSSYALPALLLATLVEATADTVSSEIGQAYGGTPYLLTTLASVPPGTDGAITILGTSAGIVAGAVVAFAGSWAMQMHSQQALLGFAGGIVGLFFDSLLGATIERKGWLGNDLVNFLSTLFAAAAALLLSLF